MGIGEGDPSRLRRDVVMLARLLRWAPAAIGTTSILGIGLGVMAITRDGAEVRLMGASLVLGSAMWALLGLIAALCARVVVARWDDPPARPPVSWAAPSARSHGDPTATTDLPRERGDAGSRAPSAR